MLGVEEQMKVIESGAMQIVPQEELKKKLAKGTPLNIKLGVDPTSPDLHLELTHLAQGHCMAQVKEIGRAHV